MADKELSAAEKIFVPNDLDSDGKIEDYTNYKVRLFKAVPENCVLVKKNRITGKIKIAGVSTLRKILSVIPGIEKIVKVSSKQYSGLKLSSPLSKSILLSTVDRTIDYEKIDYKTLDGIMANTDIAVVVKITNPKKYMLGGREQLVQLDTLIKQLLRIYIANRNFDDLAVGECHLNQFDPSDKLGEFEDLYGIKVNRMIVKEVRLPENLQKLYNDKAEATQRKLAQAVELEAQEEKARIEARLTSINAQAEAEKIKTVGQAQIEKAANEAGTIIEKLKNQGLTEKEIMDYLISKQGNTINMRGNQSNNTAGDIAMGMMAAQKTNSFQNANQTQNTNSRQNNQHSNITNAQKLVSFIDSLFILGDPSEKVIEIRKKLTTDENAKRIANNLTEEQYNQWIEIIKNSYIPSNVQTEGSKDLWAKRTSR